MGAPQQTELSLLHQQVSPPAPGRRRVAQVSPPQAVAASSNEEEDQMAAALWEGEVSRPESLTVSIPGDDIAAFAVTEEAE